MRAAPARDAAVSRVRRLLEAARQVQSDAALVAPLADATGLSPEGVALGLSRHLEVDATVADVEALVASTVPASSVHVILSANVFTAALRALALAWAASERVTVRPSRREPVFARALVRALADPGVTLAEALDPSAIVRGEVHVYGRDATIAAVRATVGPGVHVRGHGAGMGVALVEAATDEGAAATAVADDVVAFDQRGCLSPRVVVVVGDEGRAAGFAERLHARLGVIERLVPRGALDEAERGARARYVETVAFAGALFQGVAHVVGVASGGQLLVPPTGRHVHVLAARTVDEARSALASVERFVVAVGSEHEATGRGLAGGPVRWSPLGWMQRPRLDGPVDPRTSNA